MALKKFYDIPILLLGPGKGHLLDRESVRGELCNMGYQKIIIMESTDDVLTDVTLDGKFRRIIEEFQPALIFAFFLTGAWMDGVTFELGWLCCKYNPTELGNRLKILADLAYDWDNTTPYIKDLFGTVTHERIDDTNQYSKASTRIHKCALKFTLGTQK